MERNISIYVHIPFCVKKCRYCDFPSFAGANNIDSYFSALISEIKKERDTRGRTADTVYIGGGTPSCVPPLLIEAVLDELRRTYVINKNTEISMEMNPGTYAKAQPAVYRRAGINRISLGCQSFNEKSLKRLGRIHSAEDIIKTYDILRNEGFENINLDLISSLPGEGIRDTERSLRKAIALQPEHISVYSLIIEEGTEFHRLLAAGKMKDLPDEEEQAETDLLVRSILREEKYKRYEISNYAREGRECRHNICYWKRREYRGFGLAAASLVGNRRFTNTREMVYINDPGGILSEDRILNREEEMAEFMFLGLRQTEGISASDFSLSFGTAIEEVYGEQLEDQMKKGFMEHTGERYCYNDRGLEVSNILLSEFLL